MQILRQDREFEMMQAMLYSFSKKDCCKLMRASLSLELCLSLMFVPGSEVEFSEIEIQALGNHRTSADSPIRSINISIFIVPFKKDHGINLIDFINSGVVDIIDETVEELMEMLPSRRSS